MVASLAPMQKSRLFLLAMCHFLVDKYATMLAPVLPLIILRLDLSNASAGVLGTIVALIGMSQPLMGLWADRVERSRFVIAGVALAAIFTPLLGLAPNFPLTVLALALGGIGVAAFHPSSFALAGDLSGSRRAFGLALFIFGGTIALGMTPLWITHYASRFGLQRLPWLSLPGVTVVLVAARWIPASPSRRGPAQSFRALMATLAPHRGVLLLITAIVALRSVTAISFGTFLAVLEHERGVPVAEAGRLPLSVYLTSGVVGALVAGYLADRMHPRPLVVGGILLSAPLLWAYLHVAPGWSAYLLLGLGGAMILSSNSVLVSIAQEIAPENASLASSLPQGLAWGLGGMALPLVGHTADLMGMQATLSCLALLPVGTAALALLLPGKPHPRQRTA